MTTNLLSVIEQLVLDAEFLLANIRRDAPQLSGRAMGRMEAAIAAGKQALEQTQGEWKHCSPELLASGVSCKDAPRRPCECEHGGSHDHWITHPQATEPAPSTAVEREELAKQLLYYSGEGIQLKPAREAQRRAAALLSAPALPAAAMQLADDFAAAAVNHYSAGENDKALWQKMVDARQALETKLMGVK